MSVSLYYSLSRSTPFSPEERGALDSAMEAANASETIEVETLGFWGNTTGPQTELRGSSKLLVDDPIEIMEWTKLLLDTMTHMRRAVPDADWDVSLQHNSIPWDESAGYQLPGLDELLFDAIETTLVTIDS